MNKNQLNNSYENFGFDWNAFDRQFSLKRKILMNNYNTCEEDKIAESRSASRYLVHLCHASVIFLKQKRDYKGVPNSGRKKDSNDSKWH